ncbi:MAG: TIGR04211 family SH3 domain-containing protein [Litorilituus sp.]|jgi:SH3 domain protein|nr:TIGR04211 family SH3 domain-containing protein [Litorilituus sp.]
MNILALSLRQAIKQSALGFFIIFSTVFSLQAQENPLENKQGYISDDLFIYMHAGPSTNYRILGTINAGAQIVITGKVENNYSEIIDEKKRVTWVESKYVTSKPGLRFVVAELNGKIASRNGLTTQLDGKINELTNNLEQLNQEKLALQNKFNSIKQQFKQTKSKVRDQDTKIKTQWFFNGAMVLGVGLFLGLILPKFFTRRRSSMDSWS